MILAQLRIRTALLQEERHHVEGILGERLVCAKRPRREDQNIEAGCEDLRDERWVYPRLSRRGVPHEGVPIPTEGNECVDTWLDSL